MTIALAEEPLPRSDATVEQLAAPMVRRSAKLTRGVALFFLVTVAAISAVIAVLGLTDAHRTADSVREDLTTAVVIFAFVGVLPALAVRYLFGRDGKIAPDLVRHGVARYGHVVKHQRLGYGGMHFLKIRWQEDGRENFGSFDVEKLDGSPEGVTVLATPGSRAIGAVIGDQGLFIGRRA